MNWPSPALAGRGGELRTHLLTGSTVAAGAQRRHQAADAPTSLMDV